MNYKESSVIYIVILFEILNILPKWLNTVLRYHFKFRVLIKEKQSLSEEPWWALRYEIGQADLPRDILSILDGTLQRCVHRILQTLSQPCPDLPWAASIIENPSLPITTCSINNSAFFWPSKWKKYICVYRLSESYYFTVIDAIKANLKRQRWFLEYWIAERKVFLFPVGNETAEYLEL